MRAIDTRRPNVWSTVTIILLAIGFVITWWALSRGLGHLSDSITELNNRMPEEATLLDLGGAIASVDDIRQTTQETAARVHEIHSTLNEQFDRFDMLQASLLQLQADFPVLAMAPASDGFALVNDDALSKVYQLLCSAIPNQPVDRVLYLVSPGDTLWQISARFTGNPALYTEIARANNLPENGSTIWPGQWIWIPTRLLSPTLRASQPNIVPPVVAEICGPYTPTESGSSNLQLQLNI